MSLIAEIQNLTSRTITKVVSRNQKLDDILRLAGYDPEEINKIYTPLIGAGRYTSLKALVLSNGFGLNISAPYTETGSPDQTELYLFRLIEPSGVGGIPSTGKDPQLDINTGGEIGGESDPAIPPPPPSGGGETQDFAPNTTSGSSLVATGGGRQMLWMNLTCVSIQQLVLSGGSTENKVDFRPRDNGDANQYQSVYVMEFVDARYFLKDQMLVGLDESTDPKKGKSIDQWNMIAENPLHLKTSTVKNTTYKPVNTSVSWFDEALGDIDPAKLWGVIKADRWYDESPYSPKEILDNIVQRFYNTKLWGDKDGISFEASIAESYYPKNSFDCINLDLRSRSVGDALDEIASRIGCVWAWDRALSKLFLVEALEEESVVNVWLSNNASYREAGGLSSLNIDMPSSVVTVHPILNASTYGMPFSGGGDAFNLPVIQDWRTFPDLNGVQDFKPTTPLYYCNTTPRTNKKNNRTAFIGDHLPAFWGVVKPLVFDWKDYIPAIEEISKPWNLDNTEATSSAWLDDKTWSSTIEDRNQTLTTRFKRLSNLVSGSLALSRIPAILDFHGVKRMDFTPTVGLQHETILFGMGKTAQVQYRIWGDKKDPLLCPWLVEQPRISALGLSRCRNVHGALNIEYLKPRSGLVRSFICAFSKYDELVVDQSTGKAIAWRYQFHEQQLTNLPFPQFQPNDETNSFQNVIWGMALNLHEVMDMGSSVAPHKNFDGGYLNYVNQPSAATSIFKTPLCGNRLGITICYEIINEAGMTTYWIACNNGVDVLCPTAPLTSPNANWVKTGISGIGFSDDAPLAQRIMTT